MKLHLLSAFTSDPFAGYPLLLLRDPEEVSPSLASALASELARETVTLVGGAADARVRAYREDGAPIRLGTEGALAAVRILADEGQDHPSVRAGETSWPGRAERAALWIGVPRPAPREVGELGVDRGIARALGLPPDSAAQDARILGDVLLVPVDDRHLLGALAPIASDVAAVAGALAIDRVLLFAPTATPDEFLARAFAGESGREISGSGDAAGALAAIEAVRRDGPVSLVITSGEPIGRSSLVRVRCAPDAVRIWVGGAVGRVADGEVEPERLSGERGRGDPVR